MGADSVSERRVNLLGVHGRRIVRAWCFTGCHGAFEARVVVGWHPDGWWWVDDGRARFVAWVYSGTDQLAVRDAAFARAYAQMDMPYPHDGWWEDAVAAYEPGVLPARAAESAPQWPPGFEPQG